MQSAPRYPETHAGRCQRATNQRCEHTPAEDAEVFSAADGISIYCAKPNRLQQTQPAQSMLTKTKQKRSRLAICQVAHDLSPGTLRMKLPAPRLTYTFASPDKRGLFVDRNFPGEALAE